MQDYRTYHSPADRAREAQRRRLRVRAVAKARPRFPIEFFTLGLLGAALLSLALRGLA